VVDPSGHLVGILTATDLLRGAIGLRPHAQDPMAYLDVQLTAPTQTLAEAVGVLEGEGYAVLGACHGADPSAARMYRLHVEVDDPTRPAETLREHGFVVRAVHHAAAAR
jgi:hypothetical protein